MIEYQLSKDKRYLELFSGGSLHIISKIIFTTKKHMEKDKNQHHPNKEILDRLKKLNNHAKQ
jgi:hypothetical protein